MVDIIELKKNLKEYEAQIIIESDINKKLKLIAIIRSMTKLLNKYDYLLK